MLRLACFYWVKGPACTREIYLEQRQSTVLPVIGKPLTEPSLRTATIVRREICFQFYREWCLRKAFTYAISELVGNQWCIAESGWSIKSTRCHGVINIILQSLSIYIKLYNSTKIEKYYRKKFANWSKRSCRWNVTRYNLMQRWCLT